MDGYPRGIYEEGDELHVDLDEFIRGQDGDPRDPEDRAVALRAIAVVFDGIPIEVRER